MSGQPYRYFTDPTRFRTEYMESLGLRADLDSMNYDANKTYKETGQLPAVSQMKDTRSTSEILLDYEKLKIDIANSIAKVSNSQFGQLVVQDIINSHFNTDNKLLVFSAQRIDDIVGNLKKIYKYGIKGDGNDSEQLVKFIEAMYNDKNAIVSQTKSFMNRYAMKSLNSPSPFAKLYEGLVKTGATVRNYIAEFSSNYGGARDSGYEGVDRNKLKQINTIIDKTDIGKLKIEVIRQGKDIVDYIATVLPLIPTDPNKITAIENYVVNFTQKQERQRYDTVDQFYQERTDTSNPDATLKRRQTYDAYSKDVGKGKQYGRMKEYLGKAPADKIVEHVDIRNIQRSFDEEFDILAYYLDFLNLGLPNENLVTSLVGQLIREYENYDQADDSLEKELITNFREQVKAGPPAEVFQQFKYPVESSPSFISVITSLQNVLSILQNIEGGICPNAFWDIPKLELLQRKIKTIEDSGKIQVPRQVNPSAPVNVTNFNQFNQQNIGQLGQQGQQGGGAPVIQAGQPEGQAIGILGALAASLMALIGQYNMAGAEAPNLQQQIVEEQQHLEQGLNEYNQIYGHQYVPQEGINLDELLNPEFSADRAPPSGSGIRRRRGRPRGCGIVKPISYKESVKSHAVLDKGIMETPRFLKFGKYLVNNHRLHNEDIFALKRPSGGNIVEIPSIKVSKNLAGVIKKMLGGAIPTYSDISKLSEPEKTYLHKISQKSNILDKFDIPAPSKDSLEKDIHQFEVMRGEIMAGNDNKELLKKFKLHILKLSKSGTLPKREVQEILEDLLELGN